MKLEVLRSSDSWASALARLSADDADVYFTWDYHHLHEANGDGVATAAIVSQDDMHLFVPGLRIAFDDARWDLQTCNGYGGPLASKNASRAFLDEAWQEWKAHAAAEGCIAAFFRLHPLAENSSALPRDAKIVLDRRTAVVDLSGGAAQVLARSDSRHRNMVAKAHREGAGIEWNAPDAWPAFETLYAEAMDRLGAARSLRFSSEYFREIKATSFVEIASLRDAKGLVSASLFLWGSRWGHYHLSARRADAPNFATSAILQSAIERAIGRGLLAIHLGGGRTKSPDDALLKFKTRISSRLCDFSVALVEADPKALHEALTAWSKKSGRSPAWLLGYREPA